MYRCGRVVVQKSPGHPVPSQSEVHEDILYKLEEGIKLLGVLNVT
jgi:hypothetical protein